MDTANDIALQLLKCMVGDPLPKSRLDPGMVKLTERLKRYSNSAEQAELVAELPDGIGPFGWDPRGPNDGNDVCRKFCEFVASRQAGRELQVKTAQRLISFAFSQREDQGVATLLLELLRTVDALFPGNPEYIERKRAVLERIVARASPTPRASETRPPRSAELPRAVTAATSTRTAPRILLSLGCKPHTTGDDRIARSVAVAEALGTACAGRDYVFLYSGAADTLADHFLRRLGQERGENAMLSLVTTYYPAAAEGPHPHPHIHKRYQKVGAIKLAALYPSGRSELMVTDCDAILAMGGGEGVQFKLLLNAKPTLRRPVIVIPQAGGTAEDAFPGWLAEIQSMGDSALFARCRSLKDERQPAEVVATTVLDILELLLTRRHLGLP